VFLSPSPFFFFPFSPPSPPKIADVTKKARCLPLFFFPSLPFFFPAVPLPSSARHTRKPTQWDRVLDTNLPLFFPSSPSSSPQPPTLPAAEYIEPPNGVSSAFPFLLFLFFLFSFSPLFSGRGEKDRIESVKKEDGVTRSGSHRHAGPFLLFFPFYEYLPPLTCAPNPPAPAVPHGKNRIFRRPLFPPPRPPSPFSLLSLFPLPPPFWLAAQSATGMIVQDNGH